MTAATYRMQRDSGLELLRIVAMLLIVCHHFSVHSAMPLGGNYTGSHPFNVLWAQWLAFGGKLGVDIFVMISGYFLIAKCAHLKSLLRLILTTAFYGGVIYCIYALYPIIGGGINDISFKFDMFVSSMKPDSYWFIACYISLFVLSPFLSIAFNALSKKQHLAFCVLAIAAVILFSDCFGGRSQYFSGSLVIFIACFCFAAYIRLHMAKEEQNTRLVLLVLALAAVFMALWPLICKALGQPGTWFRFAHMQAIPVLLLSACLLMLFRKLRLPDIPWLHSVINSVAATTLGIYLIHDNNIVRPWLWKKLLQVNTHLESAFFPLWSVIVILGVFIACSCIERLRRLAVDPIFSLMLKPVDALDKKVAAFFAISPCSCQGHDSRIEPAQGKAQH